jgi:hypothetical protein
MKYQTEERVQGGGAKILFVIFPSNLLSKATSTVPESGAKILFVILQN